MNPIYLDHNATTALDLAARDEILPWLVQTDGRVLVMGTTDTAGARSLVAKYIGS
jgi:hypothetical protein